MVLYLAMIGFGVFMIAVAVFNWEFWFFDPESRLMEVLGGEQAVRWYWAVSGFAVIVAGVLFWTKVL